MALTDTAVLDLLLTARYVGGPAFRQMESDISGLYESTSVLEKAGQVFQTMGNLAMVAGTAIAVGLGAAAEKALVYDQSLQRIAATAPGVAPHLQELSNLAMDLSDKWGISAQSIVDGSYFLLSGVQALGYTYNDVIHNQILPAFAAYVEASGAGKAGAVDFQTAAQDLPHVLAGMHVPIQQWADALGQLTVVESQSGLSQQQLLASMTRFAPTAGFLGMDFGQTAALAGALSTLGVSGSGTGGARVGTEEAAALRNLFAGSGKSYLMKLMGTSDPSQLNQFFNAKTGQLSNVDPLLTMLYAGLNSPSMTKDPQSRLTLMNKLFGATGARAMAEMMTPGNSNMPSGIAVYQKELKAMGTPGMAYDTMLRIAGGQASGPQAQWDIMKQRLENLAIVIGNQVIPVILQFANWLGTAAHNLREFVGAHKNIGKDLVAAVPALIGGGLGLKGVGGVLSFLGANQRTSGKTMALADDAFHKAGNYGPASLAELEKFGWKPSVLQRVGQASGGLFGFGQRAMGSPFQLLGKGAGALGDKFALRHFGGLGFNDFLSMAMGQPTQGAATALQNRQGEFAARKFFSNFHKDENRLNRRAKFFPRDLMDSYVAGGGSIPQDVLDRVEKFHGAALTKKMAGKVTAKQGTALFGDIGMNLKNLGGGAVEKVVNLFKNLGPAIKGVVTALPGLTAGMLPFLAIALVVAGIIAIVILTFTHFRKEAETAGKTIMTALNPSVKKMQEIFSGAVKQIQGAWNKAWPAISAAMQSFFKELPKIVPLLKVLGAVIGAIVAVILAVIVGLVNGFIQALPYVIGFVSKVISFFGDLAKFLIDIVKAIFGKGGWGAVGNDLKAIWSDIWGIITNFVGMIVHFLWGFIQGIIGFFQHLWDVLVGHSIIPDLINGIISWFQQLPGRVFAFIVSMTTSIVTHLTSFATTILNTASTIGSNIIKGIGSGFQSLTGWLGGILGGVIRGAVNLIPGGATAAKFFHIPGFALGTMNAPGGMAMVGENGPELMYVPQGSQIYPHGQGPAQGPQQGSNTFWETRTIQSIRESRYGPTLPVTRADLLRQLDPQYRYSYQYTA